MSRPFLAALLLTLPTLAQAEDAPVADTTTVQPPAITVSAVEPILLRDRVIASGLVVAVEQVQVQPLVEGQQIETLLADIGDTVTAGQVLAQLSRTSLDLRMAELVAQQTSVQASIEQAEASLGEATASADEAQRVADRNDTLVEQGTISRAAADQADAAADAARARVRAAEQGIASANAQATLVTAQIASLQLSLDRTAVIAPVGGTVVARNAQVGGIASAAGQPMFTIVRDGALELMAEVAEQDLVRLIEGQNVALTGIGWPQAIGGTVRLVEPTINTQTRLGNARITIADPSLVRVGMFLSAEILVTEGEVLAVPVTAVSAGASGATVLRVVDGVAERVPVTTGIRDGGLIGITDGLQPDDLVVTKAAAFVRDGDRITPVAEETLP
jgi:HlyD family secretion protein